MNGSITKLSRNKNDLRTKSMKGTFKDVPEVGSRFVIFGESLTPGGSLRMISTSIVQAVEVLDDGWKIQTENTKYKIAL